MIQPFFQTYGYGAIFILVALESRGVPFRGKRALLTAAAFAVGSTDAAYRQDPSSHAVVQGPAGMPCSHHHD